MIQVLSAKRDSGELHCPATALIMDIIAHSLDPNYMMVKDSFDQSHHGLLT